MPTTPDLTLYSLEGSRSIRTAWLLEELQISYTLVSSPRAPNFLAPQDFKDKIPTFLGKSPAIEDHGIVIQESSAIADYICETYDAQHRLLPPESAKRAKVREFMAASEATLFLHVMPVFYSRWMIPETETKARDGFAASMSVMIQKDLDWIEFELKENEKRIGAVEGEEKRLFLVGDDLTAADTMMLMSIQTVFERQIGTGDFYETERWARLKRWVREMEGREAYKAAVQKTNHRQIK